MGLFLNHITVFNKPGSLSLIEARACRFSQSSHLALRIPWLLHTPGSYVGTGNLSYGTHTCLEAHYPPTDLPRTPHTVLLVFSTIFPITCTGSWCILVSKDSHGETTAPCQFYNYIFKEDNNQIKTHQNVVKTGRRKFFFHGA